MPKAKKTEAPQVGQVLGRRIEEVRRARRMTQAELAEKMTTMGYPMNRVTVAKIEAGGKEGAKPEDVTRAVLAPLRDVMAFALALDVAPIHLFIPLEDDASIRLTERTETSAAVARMWMRGEVHLQPQDPRYFTSEVPRSEWEREERYQQPAPRAADRLRVLLAWLHTDDIAAEERQQLLSDIEEEAKRVQGEVASVLAAGRAG